MRTSLETPNNLIKFENNVPIPQLDNNQVLIEVQVVNPIDLYMRISTFVQQPFPLCSKVDGRNVSAVKQGDRVYDSTTKEMNNV